MLHARGGVELFRHDQGLGIKIERDRGIRTRRSRRRFHFPLGRLHARHRIHHRFQVLRRSSAASAHDAHSKICDEMLVILRQLLGLEFVHRAPAFILREPRVRQDRNIFRRIDAQIAHRVIHFLWPGRAVEANYVYVKRFDRSQRRADFRPQKHSSGSLKRYLNCNRQPLPCFLQGLKHTHQRRLGLQQVLGSLDQQNIHPALDQCTRLLHIPGNHVIKPDMPQ